MATTSSQAFEPNTEQQRIIDYEGGHLQVIACAGSGKTEAISRRVARLIVKGVSPREIIAFTFTKRAAAALKSRILLRVAESLGSAAVEKVGPMYIGTIHSYCFRLLQEHVPEFANFDVLDDHRHAALLSREFKRLKFDRLGGNGHWRSIGTFIRNVDVVENELVPATSFAKTDFGRVYQDYCAMLQRYRFLTYGQMITTAVKALKRAAVFESVHGPLKYLFVDEYQDINPAQEELIRMLAQPPVCLYVVGDDDQAIYQWRGSDVANIQHFLKRYPSAKALQLSTNRRSRPRIIEAANEFAKSIMPRLEKKMQKKRGADGPELFSWSAETAQDEATRIAETIQQLLQRGYRPRSIGILLRSVRTSAHPILEALRNAGIAVRCAGRTGLFQQPEVNLLGSTYAWLADRQWSSEGWASAQDISLRDLLREYTVLFDLKPRQTDALKVRLSGWKNAAGSEDDPANLVRDYYLLLRCLCIHQWNPQDLIASAKLGMLARFSQLLADFEHTRRRSRKVEESGEQVGGQIRGPWYYQSLFNYLQYYARDAYEDFEGEETFDTDAVDVLTVHQAKGLEWPVVFVPSLVQGRFPSRMAGRQGEWLLPQSAFGPKARQRYEGSENDERRLFYVAMTRARDIVYLSRFRRINNRKSASPFLVEVAGKDPELATALPLPPPYQAEDDAQQETPTLAFSDVATYETCPFSYRLSALLGFQPQLAAELGYGKAVHHILRRLADHVRTQQALPTESDLGALFQQEFYLPFAHRFAFEQLHKAATRIVQRYLSDATCRNDLFRVWVTERPFELHLENGSLTGRADVILDQEGGRPGAMAIVDYKTSTADTADPYRFQLAIYAAAGRAEGIDVRAAYVHDLGKGKRDPVSVDVGHVAVARERARQALTRIANREFPYRKGDHCSGCDVRYVCRHGPGR